VDFENATWTISKERMKGRNTHVVYLSRQALDIFVALHTCAAGSHYVLPSRYDIYRCMLQAIPNRITQLIASRAKDAGLPLGSFTVHDLRRTGSTLLNEAGFNGVWIEMPGSRRRSLLALGLQQGWVRGAAPAHAAGVGGHDRRLD
jgi:integrase